MAERQQLSTTVSVTTRELVWQACIERKCMQGELIEAAALAYLAPNTAPTTEPLLFERLLNIEEVLGQMVRLLQVLVAAQEAQAKPAPPPIATYEQLYGPITAEEALAESGNDATLVHDLDHAPEPHPAPSPAPRSRFRRWFVRETTG